MVKFLSIPSFTTNIILFYLFFSGLCETVFHLLCLFRQFPCHIKSFPPFPPQSSTSRPPRWPSPWIWVRLWLWECSTCPRSMSSSSTQSSTCRNASAASRPWWRRPPCPHVCHTNPVTGRTARPKLNCVKMWIPTVSYKSVYSELLVELDTVCLLMMNSDVFVVNLMNTERLMWIGNSSSHSQK